LGTESLQEIPDFAAIRNLLESERRTIIKINKFSEEDEYVRSVEDAGLVLDLVEEIQTKDKTDVLAPSSLSCISKVLMNGAKSLKVIILRPKRP
jgi:hypothetical protein